MSFRKIAVFCIGFATSVSPIVLYPVGSQGYLQNKEKLLHEKQEYYLNEESFARMMRLMMTNGDAPGIFFFDVSLTSPVGTSFAAAVELGSEISKGWGLGVMAGLQVYVLPSPSTDRSSSSYYTEKNKGLNFFSGLDLYSPYGKIFAGVRVTDGELKTDQQIENEAMGGNIESTPLSKILRPYIFINSSKLEMFQARLDASSDLKRLGTAALLGFFGINAGAAFDKAATVAGTQDNTAAILRKGIGGTLNAFSEWVPHIELRYGRLIESLVAGNNSGVTPRPDTTYYIAEVNYIVLAGISYKAGEKPGFRLGVAMDLPNNQGFFIASVQTNYVLNTIYGSSQNDWSVYASICFTNLAKDIM